MTEASVTSLREATSITREWLFEHALPLWWDAGADHVNGGFFEKLDQRGKAVGPPTRVRVQARQLYVFAEAGRLGWRGPWRDALNHALSFMLGRYSRPDGLFNSTLDTSSEAKVDLYDQAFVLFALAHAYRVDRRGELLSLAQRLIARMDAWLAHPLAGYEEANPRQLPLRSNPQMHLLEAFLAWVEVDADPLFASRARMIIQLAESKLIDRSTGAIGEFFDGDWKFAAGPEGLIREPGHQFEWSYLLQLCKTLLHLDASRMSVALEAFGNRHGIDSNRRVAVFSVDQAGRVIDARARLWAQTERLRASLVLAECANGAERSRLRLSAVESFNTLLRFLDTPKRGLWWEWMETDGAFRDEASPASSLYHIVAAIREAVRLNG